MSTVTVSTFQYDPGNWQLNENNAKLRLYASMDWTDSDGVSHAQSTPGSDSGFFQEVDCTIVNHIFSIPSFDTISTLDAIQNATVRIWWQLWSGGRPQKIINGNGFVVPSAPSPTTWEQLLIYNGATQLVYPPQTYWTAAQVKQYFDTLSPAPDASDVIKGIAKLSVAPVLATDPIAVGTNDPRLSTEFLFDITHAPYSASVSKTAAQNATAIAAAVSAASSANSGIYVPVGTFECNSVSISVPVQFADGASILAPATGQTITITESVEANPDQHFGLDGTISLTGNVAQKDFWVAWWGADSAAAGAATSTALNAAFAAIPNGATMNLSRKDYTHTGITVLQKLKITVTGPDSIDGIGGATWGPRFIYVGPGVGDENAILIKNCYGSTFRGFTSLAAPTYVSPTGAKRNIYMTQQEGDFPISSQNILEALQLEANTSRVDYVGIDIDNVDQTNNEFHKILYCKIYGGFNDTLLTKGGDGIRIGHANAKQIFIAHTTALYFDHAVNCLSGSYRGEYNSWNRNNIIYYGAPGDTVSIFGDDAEDNNQIVGPSPVGSQVPFVLVAGRYSTLHGAGVNNPVPNGRTTQPILEWKGRLSVDGCTFDSVDDGYLGGFTSNFLQGDGVGTLAWGSNIVGRNANDRISETNLCVGFNTFASAEQAELGITLGGANQNSLRGVTTTALNREVIAVQNQAVNANQGVAGAIDNISVGDASQFEIAGLARPMKPSVSYVGANDGLQAMIIAILARDALGNRTMVSELNQGVAANSTLSVSDYVHVTWPKVPNATDYLLLQFSAGNWRTIATVATSGSVESYNIVSNPAGPYTYTIPTYNETVTNKLRGAAAFPIERAFADGDTTPSVIGSSDFVTANTGNTDYSTFDDGVEGQPLRVRINDANVNRFLNGSGILTRTGATVTATNGLIYSFIRRGSNWFQL